MEKEYGTKTCIVCGKEFVLSKTSHYIASGVSATIFNFDKESLLYDAFDCPLCGCQNIVQSRKKAFTQLISVNDLDSSEHPDEVVFADKSHVVESETKIQNEE